MMKDIKLLVMDVDGTLTDGKIYMSNNGESIKAFNIKDGYAIANILTQSKIVPVIITGRKSKIVENRAKELGINDLYQGIHDKISILKEIVDKYKCELENVAYIGDDLNDLECITKCGLSACPNDAVKQVCFAVDYVCEKKAGEGAVREFIEYIVNVI